MDSSQFHFIYKANGDETLDFSSWNNRNLYINDLITNSRFLEEAIWDEIIKIPGKISKDWIFDNR